MISALSPVLIRKFFVFGITFPASIFATLGLAQEFDASRLSDHGSMAESIPHAPVGVAKAPLKSRAPSEAIATPGLKGISIGADQSSGRAAIVDVPLTSVRRISIKMHKYRELTGEYRINADQTVSVPALGRIQVRNMTAADLEHLIVEKMKRITGNSVNVSVEVAEYNPVFVSGYVHTAGAIPWTHGMTVLQAQALAGGLYRPRGESLSDSDPDVVRIKVVSEIRRATQDLKRTLASHARAFAERDKLAQIEVPGRLVELVGSAEAKALIDVQTKQLQLRRDIVAAEQGRLVEASALAAEQLAKLREQQQLMRKQIDMRAEQLELLKGARIKGAITKERLLQVEALVADLQEKSTNIVVAIARIQSSLVDVKRDSERLIEDRQLAIGKEISDLERDAARMEIGLSAAREQYTKITLIKYENVSEKGEKNPVVRYEITRRKDGEPHTIFADRFTLLRPGDIVVVSIGEAASPLAQSR